VLACACVAALSGLDLWLVGLAGAGAGLVNALAGGGSLITFPALLAVGVPPVAANVTNTVALCPGYLGATLAQRRDLRGQEARLARLLPAAGVGGLAGAALLLVTGAATFRVLVPFLISLSVVLLALQGRLRTWLVARSSATRPDGTPHEPWALGLPLITLAAVYGGYFGAGLSVMVLALLGVVVKDSLTRLNALKQAFAFVVNVVAALFFLFSHRVVWSAALVMAVGALVGGTLGGRLAGRLSPTLLRALVLTTGTVVALVYFARL